MVHIDDSDLALIALGESGEGELTHLNTCEACRSQVESLSTVGDLMAQGGPMPVEAPAYLWPAIQAAIAREAEVTGDGSEEPAEEAETANIATRRAYRANASAASRRSSAVSLLGAAAVGAGVMWLGTSVLTDGEQPQDRSVVSGEQTAQPSQTKSGQERDGDPEVVAFADLAALEDDVDPATAEIVERDGERLLRVDTASLPEVEDGYLQVWLLEDDVAGMVTIGSLTSSGEEFVLPEGLSTDTFTTIDVSVEHYDGNPEHSGESLWRGAITST